MKRDKIICFVIVFDKKVDKSNNVALDGNIQDNTIAFYIHLLKNFIEIIEKFTKKSQCIKICHYRS